MAAKAFDNQKPDKDVHNPQNVSSGQHLFKHVSVKKGDELPENTIVVAWKGKEPIHNEFLDVPDEESAKAAIKGGWSVKPVLGAKGSKE
jgi:hypothetical protein